MAETAKKIIPIAKFLKAQEKRQEGEGWETTIKPTESSSGVTIGSNLDRLVDKYVIVGLTKTFGAQDPQPKGGLLGAAIHWSYKGTAWSGLTGYTQTVIKSFYPTSRIIPVNSLCSDKYTLRRPINVEVTEEEGGSTASLSDLNLYGFGKTQTDALSMLREQIVELHEQLYAEKKLGPRPKQWKIVLDELVERK